MAGTDISALLGINWNQVDQIINLIPAPVFILDRNDCLRDCNQSFKQFFKLEKQDCKGLPIAEIANGALADSLHADVLQKPNPSGVHEFQVELSTDTDTSHTVRIQICHFADSEGEPGGRVGVLFDVTDDLKRIHKLRELSILDELTGLPNRRHGLELVQNLLHQSQRNAFHFCFLLLDLDEFKKINDYEGHQAGDIVLREVAEIILELCRSYDLAFRYGGDEFIICLPNTNTQSALNFAERIIAATAEHSFQLQDTSVVRTTLSIGVSAYPDDGESLESLMTAADEALYNAKQRGRNRAIAASDPYVKIQQASADDKKDDSSQ